jgi:hypothetical protein
VLLLLSCLQETLTYAALLRLPRAMTHAQKAERVDTVLEALGLVKSKDTIIGEWQDITVWHRQARTQCMVVGVLWGYPNSVGFVVLIPQRCFSAPPAKPPNLLMLSNPPSPQAAS